MKEAEEYRKDLKSKFFLSEPQLDLACQGFKDGYNKANEWHFVKDGDLPNEDIYLVIRLNDENTCYKYCTGFWEKEEKCFHTLFCSKVNIKDIIAWKEIVLPELKESE